MSADAVAETVSLAVGGAVVAETANVTDHEACRAAVDRTVREFGGLDVLGNVAGIVLMAHFISTPVWRSSHGNRACVKTHFSTIESASALHQNAS